MATVPESCLKELDKFFANKTIQDVNRDSYLVCNLHDGINKVIVSLVFLRDWDSLESDSFNQVIIEGKGAVFQFPCYWISIPKELCIEYFTFIIKTFYKDYVDNWINTNNGSSNNNSNTNNSMGGCVCNNGGFINPHPPYNMI